MIEIKPGMRIKAAIDPVDFRKRIDGMSELARSILRSNPFSGTTFVFRNRKGTDLALLRFDGRGFWLCQYRLSEGTFIQHWPTSTSDVQSATLLAHELQRLIWGGDPASNEFAPIWRPLSLDPDEPRVN
jgi:transposase